MTTREFIVELCRTIVEQADEAEHQQKECTRVVQALMDGADEKKRMEARIAELENEEGMRFPDAILEAEITGDQRELIHKIGLHWIKDYSRTEREHWNIAVRIWAFNKTIIWSKDA